MFRQLLKRALLVTAAVATSAPALADRLFSDDDPGVLGHAVAKGWGVEALWRSPDDGNRLITGVEGLDMAGPYVDATSCITVPDPEHGDFQECDTTETFHFFYRDGSTLLTSGTADRVAFFQDPADPCAGDEDACRTSLSEPPCTVDGIAQECGLFVELAEFCLHAGVGGVVEFIERPDVGNVTQIDIGDTVQVRVRNLSPRGLPRRGSHTIYVASFTDDHGVEDLNTGVSPTCIAAQEHQLALPPEPPEEP